MFKYCLFLLTCFFLVNPNHAWFLKRVAKHVRKVVNNVGKLACKVSSLKYEITLFN